MDPTAAGTKALASLQEPVSLVLFFIVLVLAGAVGGCIAWVRAVHAARDKDRDTFTTMLREIQDRRIQDARDQYQLLTTTIQGTTAALNSLSNASDRLRDTVDRALERRGAS